MNEGTRYKENPQSTMLYPLSQTTPSARPRSSKIVLGSTLGNQNVHPRQEHLHCHLKVTGGRRRNEGHKPPAYLCVLYAVFLGRGCPLCARSHGALVALCSTPRSV